MSSRLPIGPYFLETTDRLLYRNAEVVPLPPKVFHTLIVS
jgi:hypothetical protein